MSDATELSWFRQKSRVQTGWYTKNDEKPTESNHVELITSAPLYRAGNYAVIDTMVDGLEYAVIDVRTMQRILTVPLSFSEAQAFAIEVHLSDNDG